jgi:hypothetical protein
MLCNLRLHNQLSTLLSTEHRTIMLLSHCILREGHILEEYDMVHGQW